MDLSVAVTPLYFASMAAERKALQRRAVAQGASAADYAKPDTTASLGMGVLSLTTPITVHLASYAALRRGPKGRIGRVVLGVAAGAAVATTVADFIVNTTDATTLGGRRLRKRARKVAEVGGVVTVVAGGVVLTATTAALTSTKRLWKKGAALDLGSGVVSWTAAMLWWDFAYYWNHRLQHEVRGMWAVHVPHHSSERYNLSTALRQPVAGAFGVWVPYGLVSRVGVRPNIVETSRALNLTYQYWIHTDTIRTLGAGEEVLNTPSHHRVHHGSNRTYIDRNHAGILIIWDRMFGTFRREEPEVEPVVYGLTKNIGTHNLWKVSTHEYRDMFRDVARSTNWRDRLGFVLRGPGWAYRRRDELDAVDAIETTAA